MALPDELPGEREIFRLFRLLRESTARVSAAFTRRVTGKLAALVDEERLQHPSLVDVIAHIALDSWNILSTSARDPEDPGEEGGGEHG